MDILEINEEKQIVKCEPLVTVERLVESLTAKGWIIPIVPEIGDLTVGGLVMGGGIETTSHKYGLWQNICMSYEIYVLSRYVILSSLMLFNECLISLGYEKIVLFQDRIHILFSQHKASIVTLRDTNALIRFIVHAGIFENSNKFIHSKDIIRFTPLET